MDYKLIIKIGYNELELTYPEYQALITAIENIVAGAAEPVTFTVQIVPQKDEDDTEEVESNE